MTRSARTRIKVTLLLTPAVLLSMVLGVCGEEIRSFCVRIFSPTSTHDRVGQHDFLVPDESWREPVTRFFQHFLDQFTKENPFQKGAPSNPQMQNPLRPLTTPLTIVFTRTTTDFEREAKSETGLSLPFNGGYFNPLRNRIVIDASGKTPDSLAIRRALSHELTHAILHFSYPPDPAWSAWLSEGIAQWCESENPTRALGHPNTAWLKEARRALAEGRPGTPKGQMLKRLLEADSTAFRSEANADFYYTAYALVTWLLAARRPAFLRYFEEEAAPGPLSGSTERFSAILGSVPEVEDAWMTWLNQQP